MIDLFEYLQARPYPGRGILLGITPSGKRLCAYFIMGRSENSRNRIFERTEDGIRTCAFDESKVTDPSLIIYHPLRRIDDAIILTNGEQTDTIANGLLFGYPFEYPLRNHAFEPDSPNFTPRISALFFSKKGYNLSIIKSAEGNPLSCQRFFYEYDYPVAGTGHFISTYEGFGSPLPSFSGDPLYVALPECSASDFADLLWAAMNEENRISLYVEIEDDSVIINKNV